MKASELMTKDIITLSSVKTKEEATKEANIPHALASIKRLLGQIYRNGAFTILKAKLLDRGPGYFAVSSTFL
jgi:hypothetical protein